MLWLGLFDLVQSGLSDWKCSQLIVQPRQPLALQYGKRPAYLVSMAASIVSASSLSDEVS